MKKNLIFLIINAFFFISMSNLVAATLSDNEAKKFLEEMWNKQGQGFVFGNFTIEKKGNPVDIKNRKMRRDIYLEHVAAEKMGFIKIEHINKPSIDSDSPWSMDKINHPGNPFEERVENINISPTQKGLDICKKSGMPQFDNFMQFKKGTIFISEVVKNEIIKNKLDVYRILMVKSKSDLTEVYKDFLKLSNRHVMEERKHAILLKYDFFENKWKIIAVDNANLNEDLKMKNVEAALPQ